jgi:hypothetical protein
MTAYQQPAKIIMVWANLAQRYSVNGKKAAELTIAR